MYACDAEIRFIANREVRRVPAGWEHPRDDRGEHIPLSARDMPLPIADSEITAYETASEGTPLSPAFPDTSEGRLALVRYCVAHAAIWADHRAGLEAWAAILFGNHARIAPDGIVEA